MRLPGFLRTVVGQRLRRDLEPRFLTYAVTFACNARCVMCDSWKKDEEGDLGLDEIERLFATLPRMDVVRLTGGEPFVRKDLGEIAALVRRHLRPVVLHVTTNGFLTERIVEFCEAVPRGSRLHVLVSIDAWGERHDEIRGHPQAFASAMRTVRALAPRQEELGLRLSVNQCVTDRESARTHPRLRDELAALGVPLQVVLAYAASATYSVERETEVAQDGQAYETYGDFGPSELGALFDELDRGLALLPPWSRLAKRFYLSGLRSRLLEGRSSWQPPCVALTTHMRLLPDGTVPTCQFNTRRVGDLRRQGFRELWSGEAARRQRDWVRACKGCWAECEVLPSAVYTGELLRFAAARLLDPRRWFGRGRVGPRPAPGPAPLRSP